MVLSMFVFNVLFLFSSDFVAVVGHHNVLMYKTWCRLCFFLHNEIQLYLAFGQISWFLK